MSRTAKRTFTREFKLQLMRQLLTGEKRLAQICREHTLSETLVRRWKEQYEAQGEQAWLSPDSGLVDADPQARIAALEAALGRAHLENEFLRKALETVSKRGPLCPDGAAPAASGSRRSER